MSKLKNTVGSVTEEKTNENTFKWSDLTVAPGKKAMLIGLVLALLNQFCGCFAMLNYTAKIFEDAGSSMSPNTAAIVVGIIQIIGSYMPTLLVDRAGRKVNFLHFLVQLQLKVHNCFYKLFIFLVFVCGINSWNCIGFNYARCIYDVENMESRC